jgi:hypothetical protein
MTSPARGSGEIPERLAKGAPSPKPLRGIGRAAVGGQG